MRVTFVTPPFDLSGGQRAIATFARLLSNRGHQVTAVAPAHQRPSWPRTIRSLVRGRLVAKPSQASHLQETGVATHVLDRYRPVTAADVPPSDVVVATWWETAEWVAALPPSCGVKVHFVQDYESWGWPLERVVASYRLPLHKVAGPQWVADFLEQEFATTPLAVVGYGIDTALFHAVERGLRLVPTVGLVYTDFANKGADISLRAIALSRITLPNLKVVAFGTTKPSRELRLPAGADFHYRVPNRQLRGIYSQCDAWLFGTRKEGFGLPILEAMACRTPVIGTPAGAAPELLAGGGGVLVRMEDPEDMAAAIVRVCTLPDTDWRAMSDVAHATASRYTWYTATDRFEAALVAAVRMGGAA